jgi:hypothetical protein
MKIMVKQFLALSLMFVLLLVPVMTGAQEIQQNQQAQGDNATGSGPAVPRSLSLAVAKTMQTQMVNLANKLQNNTATGADYGLAAGALGAYFANSNESGFTLNVEKWILSNQALFLNDPSVAQLQAGYKTLKANVPGIPSGLTFGQYETYFTSATVAARQAFLTSVRTEGLAAYQNQIILGLNNAAASANNTRNGARFLIAGCTVPGASIAGVYLGIVALVVTGPVGWAIAAGGVALGGVGLLTGC